VKYCLYLDSQVVDRVRLRLEYKEGVVAGCNRAAEIRYQLLDQILGTLKMYHCNSGTDEASSW